MSFKYTPAVLRKLEQIFEAAAYTVRYEKGTFQSGCCLLEHRKVVVVNRFLPVEGRINALVEMLLSLPLETANLPAELLSFYNTLRKDKTPAMPENP